MQVVLALQDIKWSVRVDVGNASCLSKVQDQLTDVG